jgi:hypothetical protein
MVELSQSESDELWFSLFVWRVLCTHRYRLPENRRLALTAAHGIWMKGGEP